MAPALAAIVATNLAIVPPPRIRTSAPLTTLTPGWPSLLHIRPCRQNGGDLHAVQRELRQLHALLDRIDANTASMALADEGNIRAAEGLRS